MTGRLSNTPFSFQILYELQKTKKNSWHLSSPPERFVHIASVPFAFRAQVLHLPKSSYTLRTYPPSTAQNTRSHLSKKKKKTANTDYQKKNARRIPPSIEICSTDGPQIAKSRAQFTPYMLLVQKSASLAETWRYACIYGAYFAPASCFIASQSGRPYRELATPECGSKRRFGRRRYCSRGDRPT